MAKKVTIQASAEENKNAEKDSTVCSVLLIMGAWQNSFTEAQNNIIIAEALNHCIFTEGLKLTGYLIAQKRAFLVMKHHKPDLTKKMLIFHHALLIEIKKQFSFLCSLLPEITESPRSQPDLKRLFNQYLLKDQSLIQLITGHRVELPYYDPQLERLKSQIYSNPFCSVIDYSGAKGPVIIYRKD
ncbi:MAG: hypothetical protein H7Y13_08655 [Sphingobacteriaceae bacterium]|nr:hypothetical protein [Sphingobacteriaceae bacterium]